MTPSPQTAKAVARAYHNYWRANEIDLAADLLAEAMQIETPINTYPGKAEFVATLAGFSPLVTDVGNFLELEDAGDVVQIYDMTVAGLGTIRIAEHFVIADGKIVRLRQIHDTASLRAAGFDREG